MAIALMLVGLGVGLNIVMLSRAQKGFPRFAKTCQSCGCQTPPMEYPPAVYDCPICQWMINQNLHHQMGQNRDRLETLDR